MGPAEGPRCEWLDPGDPRWDGVLARLDHDVYHTPGYLRSVRETDGGEAVALWIHDDSGDLLVPLLVRAVPGAPGVHDATSPYGYPGPLWRGATGTDSRRHWQTFLRACRERGLVSVFLRLHPFLASAAPPQDVPGEQVGHGNAYVIDLDLPEGEYQARLRKDHRKRIRHLREAGFRTVFDDWAYFGAFVELYRQTMCRVDADAYYHFDQRYFETLRAELGDSLHLCTVLDAQDRVACAGVLIGRGRIIHHHLSGVAERGGSPNPTRLLDDDSRRHFAGRGFGLLNLGGGLGGADGPLARYKRGFSTGAHPYLTSRIVVDEALYRRLSCGVETPFFPAYRDPSRVGKPPPGDDEPV